MPTLDIPGRDVLHLHSLVLDFNGTIAQDGQLIEGVSDRLIALATQLSISVITADTHGNAATQLKGLPCQLELLGNGPHDLAKAEFVAHLGAEQTVAIGNGYNDHMMLKQAAIGIAVLQREGASGLALHNADIVCLHIHDALDLLLYPKRIIATLRR